MWSSTQEMNTKHQGVYQAGERLKLPGAMCPQAMAIQAVDEMSFTRRKECRGYDAKKMTHASGFLIWNDDTGAAVPSRSQWLDLGGWASAQAGLPAKLNHASLWSSAKESGTSWMSLTATRISSSLGKYPICK